MRIEHEDKDFYAVYDAPERVRTYIRFSITPAHRRFESTPCARWLVHSKYVDNIKQLVIEEKSDAYATLFLTKNAPSFMIEAAWKALAREHHPDRGGNPDAFKSAQAAYEEIKRARDNDGNDST